MTPLLKQARKGLQIVINQNKQTLTLDLESDPADPWGTTTNKTFTGRISHERRINNLENNPSGMSTDLSYFLIVDYKVDYLIRGNIITDSDGKKWKLGAVDPLKRFGGILGYQSPLEEAV